MRVFTDMLFNIWAGYAGHALFTAVRPSRGGRLAFGACLRSRFDIVSLTCLAQMELIELVADAGAADFVYDAVAVIISVVARRNLPAVIIHVYDTIGIGMLFALKLHAVKAVRVPILANRIVINQHGCFPGTGETSTTIKWRFKAGIINFAHSRTDAVTLAFFRSLYGAVDLAKHDAPVFRLVAPGHGPFILTRRTAFGWPEPHGVSAIIGLSGHAVVCNTLAGRIQSNGELVGGTLFVQPKSPVNRSAELLGVHCVGNDCSAYARAKNRRAIIVAALVDVAAAFVGAFAILAQARPARFLHFVAGIVAHIPFLVVGAGRRKRFAAFADAAFRSRTRLVVGTISPGHLVIGLTCQLLAFIAREIACFRSGIGVAVTGVTHIIDAYRAIFWAVHVDNFVGSSAFGQGIIVVAFITVCSIGCRIAFGTLMV